MKPFQLFGVWRLALVCFLSYVYGSSKKTKYSQLKTQNSCLLITVTLKPKTVNTVPMVFAKNGNH